MKETMKALRYMGAKEVILENVSIPKPKTGEVLIEVHYAGICGSDLIIYKGKHPRAQEGLIMGHELSGIVVSDKSHFAKGTAVTMNPLISCGHCPACKRGDRHVCETLKLYGIDEAGGMAEYICVPESAVVPLPKGISLQEGAIVEPLAVVVHALREVNYKIGSSCVVFGCGTIGLLTAMALRYYGAHHLYLVESNDKRRAYAESLGFRTMDPQTHDIEALVKVKNNGYGMDYVFDCAGVQAVADLLPKVVCSKGHIVVIANYKDEPSVDFQMGMFKEFLIQFVRVYRQEDFEIAAQLIKETDVFNAIITNIFNLDEVDEGFTYVSTPNNNAIKVLYNVRGKADTNE